MLCGERSGRMPEIMKADGLYLDALAGKGPLPLEPTLADDATGLNRGTAATFSP